MTLEERAYLAGIIDGEGWTAFQGGTWKVTVTSTDRELINWIHEKTGVGTVSIRDPNDGVRQRAYYWRCFGKQAIDVLGMVAPYLVIDRKREIAQAAQRQQQLF